MNGYVDYVFRKLWELVSDARNLRMALARVAGNRGRRTAGVEGITVGKVAKRVDTFIAQLRSELTTVVSRCLSPPRLVSNPYRMASARRHLFATHHGEPGA